MSHAKSELDLLWILAGELSEEVDDLKDELKKAKEQAEAGQNEAEWWRVKHYQEQYRMRQQVRDLEDEINALKEENMQAGRHSREGVAERRENRQRRDQIFDAIRCFMCETPATEACILECGHSFHIECLIRRFEVADRSNGRGMPALCPSCRNPVLRRPIRNRVLEDISTFLPDAEALTDRHDAYWDARFATPDLGTESQA